MTHYYELITMSNKLEAIINGDQTYLLLNAQVVYSTETTGVLYLDGARSLAAIHADSLIYQKTLEEVMAKTDIVHSIHRDTNGIVIFNASPDFYSNITRATQLMNDTNNTATDLNTVMNIINSLIGTLENSVSFNDYGEQIKNEIIDYIDINYRGLINSANITISAIQAAKSSIQTILAKYNLKSQLLQQVEDEYNATLQDDSDTPQNFNINKKSTIIGPVKVSSFGVKQLQTPVKPPRRNATTEELNSQRPPNQVKN